MILLTPHPVFSAIFWIAILFAFIAVVSYAVAQIKNDRWNQDYACLSNLIDDSRVSLTSCNKIQKSFNELECYTQYQEKMKKSLWYGFQIKFREIKYKPDTIADRLNEINSY